MKVEDITEFSRAVPSYLLNQKYIMMKSINKVLSLLLIPYSLSGQLIPVTTQYVLNPPKINPAFAGKSGASNIAAFYRRQWAGIAKAPELINYYIL